MYTTYKFYRIMMHVKDTNTLFDIDVLLNETCNMKQYFIDHNCAVQCHMSEGPHARGSTGVKVHLSEGSLDRRFTCPKVQVSKTKIFINI